MDYLKPVAFTLLPNVGGILGGLITRTEVRTWYKTLEKPWFTPPNWLFAPMWTSLYCGMGYASYLMYKELENPAVDVKLPLALYGGQLALNWMWTPIFFGKHKIGLGTVVIWSNWVLVAGCVYTFHKVNPTAGHLMMPLLGWLTLAASLNTWIWKYNTADKSQ